MFVVASNRNSITLYRLFAYINNWHSYECSDILCEPSSCGSCIVLWSQLFSFPLLGEVCNTIHAKSYSKEGKVWHNGPEYYQGSVFTCLLGCISDDFFLLIKNLLIHIFKTYYNEFGFNKVKLDIFFWSFWPISILIIIFGHFDNCLISRKAYYGGICINPNLMRFHIRWFIAELILIEVTNLYEILLGGL